YHLQLPRRGGERYHLRARRRGGQRRRRRHSGHEPVPLRPGRKPVDEGRSPPDGERRSQRLHHELHLRRLGKTARHYRPARPRHGQTKPDSATRTPAARLANGLTTPSTYDAAGNLVSVLKGAINAALGETRFFYDADNRLRRVEDATGVKTHYLYDEAGRKIG